jgi:hypothetical protein
LHTHFQVPLILDQIIVTWKKCFQRKQKPYTTSSAESWALFETPKWPKNSSLLHLLFTSSTNQHIKSWIKYKFSGKTPVRFYMLKWIPHETVGNNFSLPGYKMVVNFCRSKHVKGSVCILGRKYVSNNRLKKCKDKILDMCAVILKSNSTSPILCCIYRVNSGNIHQFLDVLDDALRCLHHSPVKCVLHTDINVNYLTENNNKIKLDMIMHAKPLSTYFIRNLFRWIIKWTRIHELHQE